MSVVALTLTYQMSLFDLIYNEAFINNEAWLRAKVGFQKKHGDVAYERFLMK